MLLAYVLLSGYVMCVKNILIESVAAAVDQLSHFTISDEQVDAPGQYLYEVGRQIGHVPDLD